MQIPELLLNSIIYFFIPLWLVAGFGDWICHRLTRISETSGIKESLLHLIMLGEIGLPLMASLLMEINALVFVLMVAGFLLHEVTIWWDLHYAQSKRLILPSEQMIHSFQEIIPLILLILLGFLHWDQFAALMTLSADADFTPHWKLHPLPFWYLICLFLCSCLLVVFPFMEETWRCYRRSKIALNG